MTYGCLNFINKYTRILTDINGLTTKTVIDHIITNLDANQTKSGVLYCNISDHLPIFGIFDLDVERQGQHICQEKRFYNKAGKSNFIALLNESFPKLFNTPNAFENPDNALQNFVTEIKKFRG